MELAVQRSCVEIFTTQLDAVLGSQLWLPLLELGGLQRHLPFSAIPLGFSWCPFHRRRQNILCSASLQSPGLIRVSEESILQSRGTR